MENNAPAARIAADLSSRSVKWLRTAVKDMAAATIADWKQWRKSRPWLKR
jgi:hypothetical protein